MFTFDSHLSWMEMRTYPPTVAANECYLDLGESFKSLKTYTLEGFLEGAILRRDN